MSSYSLKLAILTAMIAGASVQASGAVLFSNPYTPFLGDGINHDVAVSNAFILTNPAIATELIFVNTLFPGDTPFAIDWLITTEAFAGTTVTSGHADHISSNFVKKESGMDVREAYLNLGRVSLAASTIYWLQLQNEVTANQDWAYWSSGFGPSPAYLQYQGVITGRAGAHAFAITGEFIPEPASIGLVGLGLFSLFWSRRKQDRLDRQCPRA